MIAPLRTLIPPAVLKIDGDVVTAQIPDQSEGGEVHDYLIERVEVERPDLDRVAYRFTRLDGGGTGPHKVSLDWRGRWRCPCGDSVNRRPGMCKHCKFARPYVKHLEKNAPPPREERPVPKNKPDDKPEGGALSVRQGQRPAMTDDQIDLVRRMICKDATDDELRLFLHHCNRTGLDPLARQIYAVRRAGKMVIQTGIDGYRLIADRTGAYAGNDDPVFDDETRPTKATVTVWKVVAGVRYPFTASARMAQYRPPAGQDAMWNRMPHVMLGKVAEALALRKAFPADLSGVYVEEELSADEQLQEAQQAVKVVEAKPQPTAAVVVQGKNVGAPAKGVPATGPAFVAGLEAFDDELATDGKHDCKLGDLVAGVAKVGKDRGFPADMAAWTEPQVKVAREFTKSFEAARRVKQTA